jgi:hypothetical protein
MARPGLVLIGVGALHAIIAKIIKAIGQVCLDADLRLRSTPISLIALTGDSTCEFPVSLHYNTNPLCVGCKKCAKPVSYRIGIS